MVRVTIDIPGAVGMPGAAGAGPSVTAEVVDVDSRQQGPVTVRMPPEVVAALDSAAARNFRSRSMEICARLTRSLVDDGDLPANSIEAGGQP